MMSNNEQLDWSGFRVVRVNSQFKVSHKQNKCIK